MITLHSDEVDYLFNTLNIENSIVWARWNEEFENQLGVPWDTYGMKKKVYELDLPHECLLQFEHFITDEILKESLNIKHLALNGELEDWKANELVMLSNIMNALSWEK